MVEFPILEFLNQKKTHEGFITGPGGSGKTEMLINICNILNEAKINYRVVAYTNKAVEVINKRVPTAPTSTLHSWLTKRPGINSKAKHLKSLMISNQYGVPAPLQLLIVDEFSMVSEEDYADIGMLVDPDMEGDIKLYTLYIGDLAQLPPIKSVCPVYPAGNFWLKLTKIWRSNKQLQEPLQKLRDMIDDIESGIPEAEAIHYLHANESFIRNIDVVEAYKSFDSPNKVLLAYTNEAVQLHNAKLQGHDKVKAGDVIFDSTNKCSHIVKRILPNTPMLMELMYHTANGIIHKETKYNPLKTLMKLPFVQFIETENNINIPIIFGAYNNKIARENLGKILVNLNREGKDSSQAYKMYKCVNDYTSNVDFNHCITTHKTQGSEWDYVFIDSIDYQKCKNTLEKLKLLYVGISRAKVSCFLNN